MSDSNKIILGAIEEATFKTDPGGTYSPFPVLSASGFAAALNTIRSNRKRTDAQLAASKTVGKDYTPSFPFELIPNTILDEMLRAAIRSDSATWPAGISHTGTITITAATDNVLATGAFTSAAQGDWFYLANTSGLSAAVGWYKIKTKTDNDNVIVEENLTSDETGTGTLKGATIYNGTGLYSFVLQDEYDDLTKYQKFLGGRVVSFDLAVELESFITGNVGFNAASFTPNSGSGNTVGADPTEDSAAEVDAFHWFLDHVKQSGGTEILTSFGAAFATEARGRKPLGSNGVKTAINLNALDATFTTNIDKTAGAFSYVDDAENNTARRMAFGFQAGSTQYQYLIEYMAAKITSEPGNIPGPNEDAEFELSWAAEPGPRFTGDTGNDKTVSITRVQ